MMRIAFASLIAATAACGARSSLPDDDAKLLADGGASRVDAALIDAAVVDASIHDAGSDASSHDASARCTGPLQGWSEVDVVLGGDFQWLVPAAASETSAVWLAGAVRSDTQGVMQLLRVEVQKHTPRIAETISLEGTDGWRPLALAVEGERFAVVARGANGDAWVALFARDGTPLERNTIDELQRDLDYNMEADVAFAGADVVVAAVRYGQAGDDHFVVQRRDPALGLRWSEAPWKEPPTTTLSFRFRPGGSLLRTRVALYDVTLAGLSKRPDDVSALEEIGAASSAWAGIEANSFVLERDTGAVVKGPWPGNQWGSNGSIPVYESAAGVFISGNVELAPFIGWFRTNDLAWISFAHSVRDPREIDDACDGRFLFVPSGRGVPLLHLIGEMAGDAPDDDVGDLRLPHCVLERPSHRLRRDLLLQPHRLHDRLERLRERGVRSETARLGRETELAPLHVAGDELLVGVPAEDGHHEVGKLDDLVVIRLGHLHHPLLAAA